MSVNIKVTKEDLPIGFLILPIDLAEKLNVHTGEFIQISNFSQFKCFLRVIRKNINGPVVSKKTAIIFGIEHDEQYQLSPITKEIKAAKNVQVDVYNINATALPSKKDIFKILEGIAVPKKNILFLPSDDKIYFMKIEVSNGSHDDVYIISSEFSNITVSRSESVFKFNYAFLIDKAASMQKADVQIDMDAEALAKATTGVLEFEEVILPYLETNNFPRVNVAYLFTTLMLDSLSKKEISDVIVITYGKDVFEFVVVDDKTYERLRHFRLTSDLWPRIRPNFLRFAYTHISSAGGVANLSNALEQLVDITISENIDGTLIVFILTDGKPPVGRNPFEFFNNVKDKVNMILIPICFGESCTDEVSSHLDELAEISGGFRINCQGLEKLKNKALSIISNLLIRKKLLEAE